MPTILARAAATGGLHAAASGVALAWPLALDGLVAPFWLASGVALVALLSSPRGTWPVLAGAVGLAAFLVGILDGHAPGPAALLATAAVAEPLLAAHILARWLGGAPQPRRARDAVALLGAPVPACAVGAVLGVPALAASAGADGLGSALRLWLASDYLGILLLGFAAWGLRPAAPPGLLSGASRSRLLEGLLCYGGLVAACVASLVVPEGEPRLYPHALLPVPFVAWATARFGSRGAATGAVLFAALTLGGALGGHGPFALSPDGGPGGSVAVQLYVAVGVGSTLLLAAVLAERADALALARASGEQLEQALESGGLDVWEWAVATGEVVPSERLGKLLGYGPEELPRKLTGGLELLHPEDRGPVEAQLRSLAQGQRQGVRFEVRFRSRDGAYRWFLSRGGVTERDASGAPVRVTGVHVDIDAVKRAEEQLRRQRNFANSALESLPGVFYLLDAEGRFVRWNRNMSEATGYSDAELDGLSALELFVGDRELVRARIAEVFERGEATVVASLVRRGGGTVPYYFTGRRVDLDDGTYLVGMGIDLSEQREAEAQALRERDFAATVLETIPGLFFVVDHRGRFVRWNPSFARLLGYEDADMARRSAWDLVAEEDRERMAAEVQRILTGVDGAMLVRVRARDDTLLPFLGTVRAWRHGDEVFVVGVFMDMRERLALEEERQALEDQLRQSQKLESVGRLAGGVAHDFNNLLTAILGYAQLAADELEDPAEAREALAQIEAAGERARSLTRQLLAFSRRQVLAMRELDPNQMVEEFLPLLRRALPETIELEADLDPRIGPIRADRGQIEQVLMNLMVNAADAMPRGGRIAIRTAPAELDAGQRRSRPDVAPGPYVRIVVADTGHGMDPETLEQIFEPFYTTKAADEGTGLGLATSHGIVKQHGGEIEVESAPGQGSCFHVLLPVAEPTDGAPEPHEARETHRRPAPLPESPVVLLVEDEPIVRRLVERQLTTLGYRLLVAEGPQRAQTLAEAPGQRIDLLLTDVVLPGMSGPDLYARLSRGRPELRVLFMSGYPADALPGGGLRLDPERELLPKPFRLEDLEARIRAVLGS